MTEMMMMMMPSRPEQDTTGSVTVHAEGLGYCLYRSLARPGLSREDLELILEKARVRNRALGLTGCLHHEAGMFFQWLEGPRSRLFRLLDSLREDDRHLNFTVLDQGPLQQRMFQDWEMRFSDREAASLLEWLGDWRNRTHSDDLGAGVGAFLTDIAH